MSVGVCYFTGTGNSLSVAKAIAWRIGGELISIPAIVEKPRIKIEAGNIGIVFPCYLAPLSGVPLIVERFLEKLDAIESKYLFAICTCGGYEIVNALPTLRNLENKVASLGGTLSAKFSVRLPMNNLDYSHIPVPIVTNLDRIYAACDKKIVEICERLLHKKAEKYRVLGAMFNSMMTLMYRMIEKPCVEALRVQAQEPGDSPLGFRELIHMTDKNIRVDERCNSCGTCVKVCPARNIEIVDNRPVWRHRCEACFACDEWCPQGAIQHWSRANGVKYHHPGVSLRDMVVKSGG
jgi:formate hydrogenlyase subunit 6/NADH:ubiquinone oxidoreductase subunit I/flavodoxin